MTAPHDVLDLEELVEILDITKEQAATLMDRHDEYLKELAKLEGRMATMLVITTAVALASNTGIDPVDFIRMVQGVIIACAESATASGVPDIEA